MRWEEFDKIVYRWEAEHKDKRITKIWHDAEDAPRHYTGCYSECDVDPGEPKVRLSTGELITL